MYLIKLILTSNKFGNSDMPLVSLTHYSPSLLAPILGYDSRNAVHERYAMLFELHTGPHSIPLFFLASEKLNSKCKSYPHNGHSLFYMTTFNLALYRLSHPPSEESCLHVSPLSISVTRVSIYSGLGSTRLTPSLYLHEKQSTPPHMYLAHRHPAEM